MNTRLQVVLIIISVLFLITAIYFIRKKGLDLYHSIVWFAGAVILLIMACFPEISVFLAELAGVEVPSNMVFLILIGYLMVASLSLSASLSRQHARIRRLVQTVALLDKRLRELEDEVRTNDLGKLSESEKQ